MPPKDEPAPNPSAIPASTLVIDASAGVQEDILRDIFPIVCVCVREREREVRNHKQRTTQQIENTVLRYSLSFRPSSTSARPSLD